MGILFSAWYSQPILQNSPKVEAKCIKPYQQILLDIYANATVFISFIFLLRKAIQKDKE